MKGLLAVLLAIVGLVITDTQNGYLDLLGSLSVGLAIGVSYWDGLVDGQEK